MTMSPALKVSAIVLAALFLGGCPQSGMLVTVKDGYFLRDEQARGPEEPEAPHATLTLIRGGEIVGAFWVLWPMLDGVVVAGLAQGDRFTVRIRAGRHTIVAPPSSVTEDFRPGEHYVYVATALNLNVWRLRRIVAQDDLAWWLKNTRDVTHISYDRSPTLQPLNPGYDSPED